MNIFHKPMEQHHPAHRKDNPSSQGVVLLVVLAVLYGIAATLPAYAQYQLTFPVWFLAFVGTSGIAFAGFALANAALDKLASSIRDERHDEGTPEHVRTLSVRNVFLICFAFIEVAFLFALLSNYPGLCSPDSNAILSQVNGQEYYSDTNRYEGLTNAHPIFYTFLIWLVFKATAFIGSQSISLFVFMFLQVTYVAAALAWCLAWLAKTGARKAYLIGATAFIVLSPVIASHVIILWKDIPFAATLLLLVIHLGEYLKDEKPTRKQVIELGVLLLLVSLLRNNGYYLALFTLVFLVIFRPLHRKPAAIVAVALVVFMTVLQGPIFGAFSISKGHFAESVGIPLQQLAATVSVDGTINASDQEILERILPLEEWSESYDPSTSNPIKQNELFNDEYLDTHKGEFLAVWAHVLPHNLTTYIRAWVMDTYGYWQPGYNTLIGSLTCTANDVPATDFFGMGYKPQFIANALREQFPALLGMGSLIWFSIATMVFSIIAGRKGGNRAEKRSVAAIITPYMPLIGLIGTMLLAAPIVSDYRYIFALYLVIPFLPQLYALSRAYAADADKGGTSQIR